MRLPLPLVVIPTIGACPGALGDWALIPLSTPEMSSSLVYTQSGATAGGYARLTGHIGGWPALWGPGGLSYLETPGGPTQGVVYAISGGIYAGGSINGACYWTGPAQRTDLQPNLPGVISSVAVAASGNQQAGYLLNSPSNRETAALWYGSAASFVNLHPVGYYNSSVTSTVPDAQGGWTRNTSGAAYHVTIWHGTSQSMVDLNPSGAGESWISGMAGDQQVGWARWPGQNDHAIIWHGSAAGYTDITPAGAAIAGLNATCGSAQVGAVGYGGFSGEAGIWFGTAESFVGLGYMMPAGYHDQTFMSVSQVGDLFYIGGFAYRDSDDRTDAFMWVGNVPAPASCSPLAALALLAFRRRRARVGRHRPR